MILSVEDGSVLIHRYTGKDYNPALDICSTQWHLWLEFYDDEFAVLKPFGLTGYKGWKPKFFNKIDQAFDAAAAFEEKKIAAQILSKNGVISADPIIKNLTLSRDVKLVPLEKAKEKTEKRGEYMLTASSENGNPIFLR